MRGRRSRLTHAGGFACLAVAGMATAVLLAPPASAAPASSWTTVSSPNRGIQSSLQAVSCTSPTSCVAVGDYFNAIGFRTLVESWNGYTWTIVASPDQGNGFINQLDGVSCTSSTRCVAVGDYLNATSEFRTLVESWNGYTWTIVASPNQGTAASFLSAVSCTSSSRCVAVGDYRNATGEDQTLVETGPA
jgi:hypothetical protein